MKILHVVSSLKLVDGIMGVAMNLFRKIDRSQIVFDFLYFVESKESYKTEIEELGGSVYYCPLLSWTNYFEVRRHLNIFFQQHSGCYSAVHLHEILMGFMIFPLACQYGIDCRIVHLHSSKFSSNIFRALRNRILSQSLKRYGTFFILCSIRAGRLLFTEKELNARKYWILLNPINCKLFSYNEQIREEERQKWQLEGKFVIGHVGRFAVEKNHSFLIDILDEIVKKQKNIRLMLVGDGVEREAILAKIEKMELSDYVLYVGVRKDIPRLFQAMDIFVLPSLFEGLPVVGIEAQGADLPCVFSQNITSEIEITRNVRFLDLKSSPQFWATEIIDLLENSHRSDTSALLKAKGFEIEQEVLKLQCLYKNGTLSV